MKTRFLDRTLRPLLPLVYALVALAPLHAAVDFTVDPPAISNTFSGTITVTVTGLTPGQTARVSRFLDANANGVIDPGEPLVAAFGFQDGQVTRIGGVRLTSVPGDEDQTSNGTILAQFPPFTQTDLERLTAPYLYRVSHPTNAFAPVVKPFTVTNSVFSQALTGTVLSGGTPVPYAGVAALLGIDGEFVAGVAADAGGQYSLALPAGTYQLVPFRDGYVANFQSMPTADLGPGQTLTNDLPMTAATRTISGSLRVMGTTNVLRGIQGFCQSSSGEFTLGFTDGNGDFTFGVTSNAWEVEPSEVAVAAHGLLLPRDPVTVDVTAGSVSGLLLELPPATALVYGSVRDDQNNPVAGLSAWADSQAVPLEGAGMTDANGNYSIGVGPGLWWVGFSDEDLVAAGLLISGTNVTLTSGQAQLANFVARRATARLRGRVEMPDGSTPSSELWVTAWSTSMSTGGSTAADGSFQLLAVGGNWTLQLEEDDAREAGVIGSRIDHLAVTDGVDLNNLRIIARPLTAQITGRVTGDSNPLGSLWVYAQAGFGTNRYEVSGYTDPNGYYALDVADGTWQLVLDCNDLQNRGYPCAPEQSVVITAANQVRDFALLSAPEPPTLSAPAVVNGQFQFRINGQSAWRYKVWSTPDLSNPDVWVEEGVYDGPAPLFSKPITPGSPHRFYGVEVVP